MKKPGFVLLVFVLMVVVAACAPAADSANCTNLPANGPKMKIEGPWSRAAEGGAGGMTMGTPAGTATEGMGSSSGTSAAYMVIHNCSGQADALLKAASDVAEMTEVHLTEMRNGVMTMAEVRQIDLPAGKKVELKQGSYHIMLMKLKQSIKAGDAVEIRLTFEKAGEIKVTAPARNP